MWAALAHNAVLVAAVGGSLAGWASAFLYFRQRIWVMEQRLTDYAARRLAVAALDAKGLICTVCKSRALHRSNKRTFGVVVGMAFGRFPYRCERCFSVSLHRGRTSYALAKRLDTYERSERRETAVCSGPPIGA
jgi:hypothetical protein